MAYKDEDTEVVLWNSAGLQNRRLDNAIQLIQECSLNPLATNEAYGDYNFKIIYRSLISIKSEIHSKLDEDEEKELNKLNGAIDYLMIKHPPLKQTIDKTTRKPKQRIDSRAWELLEKELNKFRVAIMKAMDNHGYSNPTQEAYDGL